MALLRFALLASAALAVAGCDSGGDEPEVRAGRFEATLTGDVERSVSGRAVFQRRSFGPDEPESLTLTFVRDLALGSPRLESINVDDFGGRITGTGTFPIDNDLLLGYLDVATTSPDGGVSLFAVSGTLRVTRFEDDRIAGSFEAELEDPFAEGGPVRARIEGAFDADALALPPF